MSKFKIGEHVRVFDQYFILYEIEWEVIEIMNTPHPKYKIKNLKNGNVYIVNEEEITVY